MRWGDTGLDWVPPSPNITRPETQWIYPATCYIEATNISEGRGTGDPFFTIGAPFVPAGELSRLLRARGVPGITVSDTVFTPHESKYRGVSCNGVHYGVVPGDSLRPVRAGVEILSALVRCCGDSIKISPRGLARLLGDPGALDLIRQGKTAGEISSRWEVDVRLFSERSTRYKIYPER